MKRILSSKRLIALAATYLVLCALAGVFLGEGAVRPPRRQVTEAATERALKIAASAGGQLEGVETKAGDGVTLKGWFFSPALERRNGNTVMILHGVADSRITQTGFTSFLLEQGYAVLIPDARAHGESGGDLATYGVRERADVHAWERWLVAKLPVSPAGVAAQANGAFNSARRPCIYGMAHSYGAAVLLQSLDDQSLMCAVVVEESFASFKEVAFDRLGQPFGASHWLGRTAFRPIVEAGVLYVRTRYGVNLADASPEQTIARSTVPIFLIHGQADDNIPIRHAALLHAANPRIAFWPAARVGHWSAFSDYPDEFPHRVLAWFARHGAAQPSFAAK